MIIMETEQQTYATQWEKDHPDHKADEFWKVYLRPDGQIEGSQDFWKDYINLGVKLPENINIWEDEFWSTPQLEGKELLNFFNTWIEKHPGISPDDYTLAYTDENGVYHDTAEAAKIEWYLDEWHKLVDAPDKVNQ